MKPARSIRGKPPGNDPVEYVDWLRDVPRSEWVKPSDRSDYTNVVRSQQLCPPIAVDPIDRELLAKDRTIETAYQLFVAKELRRIGVQLSIGAALLLVEPERQPLEGMTEPIPY